MELDWAYWFLRLSFILFIFSSRIITYLLKSKVENTLADLIFIVSILPIVPLIWTSRQFIVAANKDDKTFTFYIALISTVVILSMLMRKTYLYNKE